MSARVDIEFGGKTPEAGGSMELREAWPEDAEGLRALGAQADRFLRRFYRPSAAAIASRARVAVGLRRMVAVVEGETVGTVGWYEEGGFLHVLGLAVAEEHRRRGIARALLEGMAERARAAGCPAVRLFTVRETGNVPVFEKLGFAVIGETDDGFLEGVNGAKVHEVEMERRLSSSV